MTDTDRLSGRIRANVEGMRRLGLIQLVLFAMGTACGASEIVNDAVAQPRAWPLRIRADLRGLEDQNGLDFLIKGDAAWQLTTIADLGPPNDVTDYLDDLVSRAGNTILIRLVDEHFPDDAPRNANGDSPWGTNEPRPFVTMTDPTAEPYWLFVDDVVEAARVRGVLILFSHAYPGFSCRQGAATEIDALTADEARAYGEWLGDRFREPGNVLWVHGGDVDASTDPGCNDNPNLEARLEDMYDGIRSRWTGSLHTAHSGRGVTGREGYGQFIDDPTEGDIDTVYADCTEIGGASEFPRQIRDAALAPVPLPFFNIEGRYSNNAIFTSDACQRAQTWWPLLGGGFGAVAGNEGVWCFDGVDLGQCSGFSEVSGPWRSNLGHPGVQGYLVLERVRAEVDLRTLEPDLDHVVMTSGFGNLSDSTWAPTARSQDAVVAYLPDAREVVFDFSGLGALDARWIDPANAEETPIGLLSGADVALSPPGSGDWLFVAVPEPTSGALAAAALSTVAGIGARRRRRQLPPHRGAERCRAFPARLSRFTGAVAQEVADAGSSSRTPFGARCFMKPKR